MSENDIFKELFEAVCEEAESDMVDQITFEVMKDPIVLSSGIVLDRNTVFDNQNKLRYEDCPVTRSKLKKDAFPLSFLKGKIIDWRLKIFDSAIALAHLYKD